MNADKQAILPLYVKALHRDLPTEGTAVRKIIENYFHVGIKWLDEWLQNSKEANQIDINELYNEISKY